MNHQNSTKIKQHHHDMNASPVDPGCYFQLPLVGQ